MCVCSLGDFMKQIKVIFITLISPLILILFFQNCSKVQMSEVDLANQKTGSLEENENGGLGGIDNPTGGDCKKEDEQQSSSQYMAACEEYIRNINNAVEAAVNANISDVSGQLFLKASSLGALNNISGNVHLIGTSADSAIESIQDMHGNMIICGMDVKAVKGFTSGNLIIVNGDVGSIEGFAGNIKIIGGKLLNGYSNSVGNIVKRY